MRPIPLWAKAMIMAAIVAACLVAINALDNSRQKIGYTRAVAEYSAKLIAAQEDAKAQEMAWREQSKKSQEKTNELLNAKDANYAVLSRTNDSLRNAATNYGNGLASDTIAACRNRAATLADVFGSCSEALRDMAKAADGQFIDAVACRDQWPK